MTTIPKKQRKQMAESGEYNKCAFAHTDGHVCAGRITWEHAIIYAGRKLQERWSIIPICARAHEVDDFKDAGTMNKEANVWVALNRATDAELRAISKAVDYIRERGRLNEKYGEYVPYMAQQSHTGIVY